MYPQRRNVAAQVAEELKTVIYATPPMVRNTEKKEITLYIHPARNLRTFTDLGIFFKSIINITRIYSYSLVGLLFLCLFLHHWGT